MKTAPLPPVRVMTMGVTLLSLGVCLAADKDGAGGPRPAAGTPTPGLVWYVAPAGNDAWSGRRAEPNADRTDGPLATIARAQEVIRQHKSAEGGLKQPVTVLLRGGTYRLTTPLVFTPADSGTAQCPITYQAYPGEQPVLSGGRLITGWQRDTSGRGQASVAGKLWSVDVAECRNGGWTFNQLFVNGQRCIRARLPNRGAFLRTAGPVGKKDSRSFFYNEGDIRRWDDLREALFVVYHSWETSLHRVTDLDEDIRMVRFREPAPWPMGMWEKQQRYYVENVFEGLDEAGEWYLDRTSGRLYYYPRPGEDMASAEVVAPVVTTTLVEFAGTAGQGGFVENLHFVGIAFHHSNARLSRIRNPGQGEIYQKAMIMAAGLRSSRFENCEIAHTGGHAVWLAGGCEDNLIRQCHLHDLCGGGVYIGGGWGLYEGVPTQRNTVDNNFIHDGSHLFHGAHGVWIGRSSFNTVSHNEISNFDYSGISCGWSWGFDPSSANHNTLDYNHIHHLGNGDGLSDMGGIYTLGISPGTTERYNHIHDVYNYANVSHGSGIYPDEGSSEILIENNVVYRVRTCPLFQHYGKANIVRNNVLAFGGVAQLQRCREDVPCHYVAEGNIVYSDHPQMVSGPWKNGDWQLGRNLYWSTAGTPKFLDLDFEAWKVKAKDEGSMVADPCFVDAATGDFRLKPDSPALALGFVPIDLSHTGLYGDTAWVELPRRCPDRPRNEVPPPVEVPLVINFDYEAELAGQEPLEGTTVLGDKGASILVCSDTAASGAQSLKFTDAPGLPSSWMPHLYLNPKYERGKLRVSWDMLNSKEAPAKFYVEVRQWDVSPYLVGPTVSVRADGGVTASGREVGSIPLGEWAQVEITFELGEGTPGTYRFALSTPGRDAIAVELPYENPAFRRMTWFGISSTSETETRFYIDNLKCGSDEELARPVPRPRVSLQALRRRAEAKAPPKPENPQKLVGYWKFDEGSGDVARDSSGTGNDADMTAYWAKGTFGSAMCCREEAYAAVVPDDPTLRFGKDSFSIECWLCPTKLDIAANDKRRRFMAKSRFPDTWWNLNITVQGTPFIEMVDAGKHGSSVRPPFTIPENAWSHLAVVVDRTGAQVLYYVNGQQSAALPLPPAFADDMSSEGGELRIGGEWQPFVGLLDEVRIYRRSLTAAEILATYEQEKGSRTDTAYDIVE